MITGATHFVWNETTSGENFAEKWKLHSERAEAFYRWHRKVLGDFEQLIELEGIDALAGAAGRFLGEEFTRRAVRKTVDAVSAARVQDARGRSGAWPHHFGEDWHAGAAEYLLWRSTGGLRALWAAARSDGSAAIHPLEG